ncbi:MAG: hypothetical protein ACRBN8_10960, partial [Nannocystales bacterium]
MNRSKLLISALGLALSSLGATGCELFDLPIPGDGEPPIPGDSDPGDDGGDEGPGDGCAEELDACYLDAEAACAEDPDACEGAFESCFELEKGCWGEPPLDPCSE